jgi:hypothetical protein
MASVWLLEATDAIRVRIGFQMTDRFGSRAQGHFAMGTSAEHTIPAKPGDNFGGVKHFRPTAPYSVMGASWIDAVHFSLRRREPGRKGLSERRPAFLAAPTRRCWPVASRTAAPADVRRAICKRHRGGLHVDGRAAWALRESFERHCYGARRLGKVRNLEVL